MVCITIPYVRLHYLCHFQIILETDCVRGGKEKSRTTHPTALLAVLLIMVDFVLK